jgi:DNA ligase (NAD+)
MNNKETRERIKKLREIIDRYRYAYHVLDKEEVSSEALDSLKHELFLLEQQYPDLITPDSPTQRVAGKPLDKFGKIIHDTPMLSLEDIFEEEELFDWEKYLKRLKPAEDFKYFCELKIDGFAISLIYENSIFKMGSTRGDGRVGEDVTQNLKTIESIPLRLKENIKGIVEIRGEVYMDKLAFEKANKEREKMDLPLYANPRNLAAGSIRQLDSRLAASRDLKFLAYDLITDVGVKTHSQKHEKLKIFGFKTDSGKICNNTKEITIFWKQIFEKRKSLPFLIDGVVVNVEDNMLFKNLGVAGKSPRAGRALKFSPKQATTKVKDIKIQIGRTGSATPVAILEPVKMEGVTVGRATLHNDDEIKRLGLKIRDTVIVERAGDVIPKISKVLSELRNGQEKPFKMPINCPICETKLIRPGAEVVWRCPNVHCPARKRENLYHSTSKKAFDIEGLGPKIIDQLSEANLISDPSDIFELQAGDLLSLQRFAQKSADNLIQAVSEKKEVTFPRFIYALGIRHVGEETAIDLARRFKTLNSLIAADLCDLQTIEDIGPVASKSIFDWFREKRNLNLLNRLNEVGIKIKKYQEEGNKKLSNQRFVLTGSLDSMSRERAYEMIREMGGEAGESISSKTNYLIIGKDPGSKLQKAQKLGVKIIEEKEFLKLLNE